MIRYALTPIGGRCLIAFGLLTLNCVRQSPADEKSLLPTRVPDNTIYVPPPLEEKALAAHIEHWIRDVENPADAHTEAVAVSSLFGQPPILPGFQPPDRVKRFLLQRRLSYRSWEARHDAAHCFQYFLEHDIATLVDLMRDGLNDPHPKVRSQAIFSIEHAINLLTGNVAVAPQWDDVMKDWIEKHRDDLLDEIVDLVVSKGLTDEDTDVVDYALITIRSKHIQPTPTRLRSIDRVVGRGLVPEPYDEYAADVRDEWDRVVHKRMKPIRQPDSVPDPFGAPLPSK